MVVYGSKVMMLIPVITVLITAAMLVQKHTSTHPVASNIDTVIPVQLNDTSFIILAAHRRVISSNAVLTNRTRLLPAVFIWRKHVLLCCMHDARESYRRDQNHYDRVFYY